MKGNNASRFQRERASTPKPFSIMIVLFWCLILIWIAFLFHCWHYGLFSDDRLNAVVTEVDYLINKTETSLRGGFSKIHMSGIPVARIHTGNKNVAVNRRIADLDEVHIIFSTDCSPYQDWQTLVLFHSAKLVGQRGHITRIASGCDDEKMNLLLETYNKLYPEFSVHFTPDFKKDSKTQKSYDFYNKPWGLKHWLENANPPVAEGVTVALLDPDMILLRPITTQIAGLPGLIVDKRTEPELIEKVTKGRPAAQTYGLGAPWANDNHKKFNRHKICGENSPCLEPTVEYGELHYSVGPPYLVHKDDLLNIADSWTKFVPRVYEGYPYLLAEMYAYSMGAAHQKLPHVQLWNYMVSNVDSHDEGWKWIDALDEVCAAPINGVFYPEHPMPTVVHYCQSYRAGEIGFMKRTAPRNMFSCESPMFKEPELGAGNLNYRVRQGKSEPVTPRAAKRNAFELCTVVKVVNSALADYKQRMCATGTANFEKSINTNTME